MDKKIARQNNATMVTIDRIVTALFKAQIEIVR